MFRGLRRLLDRSAGRTPTTILTQAIAEDDLRPLLVSDCGLTHIDWDKAHAWLEATNKTDEERLASIRGIADAWLTLIRADFKAPHARWRSANFEGLAPGEDALLRDLATYCGRAYSTIRRALHPITGDFEHAALGVLCIERNQDYLTFASHYYPESGEWGTSGGMYLRGQFSRFPLIVTPHVHGLQAAQTIAHELAHHVLSCLDLPSWLEEGLTQMMEERVTGLNTFVFTREDVDRHRANWSQRGLDRFWQGEAFRSHHGDEQRLAYNLSEALVRGLLSDRPRAFFRFAASCRSDDLGHAAAVEHLGHDLAVLAARVLGPGDWSPAATARP